ncbi:hypothetical protein MesoLjLc_50810 [Mesorhizobium sp. L-8-10]|uniref:hypothetical protein n=1 Tax=Mesorhizobium sp. L-8-10 TaxID=2744523 RepID=UPI0019279DE4|nr:hypothetical protein [Mesorhizobium sp. L-8-10]BCH33151.1 hypothetical protein MesoLjLc_50810 [Mesorhizobium sp. L-8-10]
MVQKAIITDVSKLRPDLLDLSVAELERRRAEIDMAIIEIGKKEAEAQRLKDIEDAGKHVDHLLESIKWLHDRGFLPPKMTEAFSGADGQFAPHRYIKRPRA